MTGSTILLTLACACFTVSAILRILILCGIGS